MKLILKAKNLDLTEAIENFVEEKIGSVKKFIDILKEDYDKDAPEKSKTLAEVFVEVGKETDHHKKGPVFTCQLDVRLPGRSLMVKAQDDDLYKSIISAKKELKEEIEKYKFKNIGRNRRERRKAKREDIV